MVVKLGQTSGTAAIGLGQRARSGLRRIDGRVAITAIQFVCGAILAVDVGLEIAETLFSEDPEAGVGLVHIAFEVFATLLLFVSFALSFRFLREHRAALRLAEDRLTTIRGDFSGLVKARFREWGLSPAEIEIALLTLKGLRIAEIARLRDSREGTVKSHLGAIFRKSGVKSRPELLAKFVDDFLDFSAPR